MLQFGFVLFFLALGITAPGLNGQSTPTKAPAPNESDAARPSEPATPVPTSENTGGPSNTSSGVNLLGKRNSESGEAKRNENVQFDLIDNYALRELNVRLGTTATIIREFQPKSNYFGAEFGTSQPPLLHLSQIKPQSAFHGNVYWTHSNSVFSARSFFQAGSVKPSRENDYGLRINLPLWKKAVLGIEGSQHKIRGNVNGNVLIPLPGERTLLATDPEIRSLLQRWLNAYPLAAPNRADIDPRMLNTNSPQRVDTDTASFRLDQQVSANDRLVARHAITAQTVHAFQLVAGQNPDTATRSHSSRLGWDHSFSAKTTGTFTIGFDRVRSELMPEPNAVGPQVQIGSSYTTLGPGSTIPLDRVQNRFRNAALVTHRRGNHTFTFGGEFTRLQFNGRESSSNRGNYYFRSDFGRDAIANFRLGIPSRYSTGIGDINRGFRSWEQQYFAGDTWKVRRNLTINFGVRYVPAIAPHEVNNRTQIRFNCDCNNFAPTLGFAYALPGNFGVIRAAYSLQYSELYPVTFQQLRWNPPSFQKVEVQAPTLLNPLQNSVLSADGRATLFVVPEDLKTPYSHQYNFSWEAKLPKNFRMQLGYVGSRTWKILMLQHSNRALPVPGIPLTTATINDRRPDARYFDVRPVINVSRAYFDAARVTVTLPEWRGLTMDASYWFSKAIDTGAPYTNTAAGEDARQGFSQTENLVEKDLRGPSLFDQSHSVIVRFRYMTPAWGGRSKSVQRAFGRWAFSSVWLTKSGLPFTVISGSDGPGFGNVDGTTGDRPDIVDPLILGRTISHPDVSVAMLPRSAFRFMALGTSRGNIGSNTFRRAGFMNMNASLSRSWAVWADRVLTFRVESLNLMNTPQFAEPNKDLSAPSFGTITNTLNDGRTFQFRLDFRW